MIFKEKLILGKLDQIVIKYEMQFENTFLNHVKNFSIHYLSSLSQNISKDICLVLPLDIKEGVIFDIYCIKKKKYQKFHSNQILGKKLWSHASVSKSFSQI